MQEWCGEEHQDHIREKRASDHGGSGSDGLVLRFSARASYCNLLLSTQENTIAPKECAKAKSGVTSEGASSPIGVRVGIEIKGTSSKNMHAIVCSTLSVTENPFDKLKMSNCWGLYELTRKLTLYERSERVNVRYCSPSIRL